MIIQEFQLVYRMKYKVFVRLLKFGIQMIHVKIFWCENLRRKKEGACWQKTSSQALFIIWSVLLYPKISVQKQSWVKVCFNKADNSRSTKKLEPLDCFWSFDQWSIIFKFSTNSKNVRIVWTLFEVKHIKTFGVKTIKHEYLFIPFR